MGNLILRSRNFNLDPFDIMFRDLFDSDSLFEGLVSGFKINYPVDIKETKDGLEIDIAAVGLNKDDINIEIDEDILRVSCDKKENSSEESENYIYRGIARRSFNMAWRISHKFDLNKLEAKLDKGLLQIHIPLAQQKVTKKIEIK